MEESKLQNCATREVHETNLQFDAAIESPFLLLIFHCQARREAILRNDSSLARGHALCKALPLAACCEKALKCNRVPEIA